jgi:23S rRNA-/tRNA-specific pseudouridylate synthase
LGHPIICDPLYGKSVLRQNRSGIKEGVYLSSFKQGWKGNTFEERPLLDRLGLHAARLTVNGIELEAPLPKDLAALLKQFLKGKQRLYER